MPTRPSRSPIARLLARLLIAALLGTLLPAPAQASLSHTGAPSALPADLPLTAQPVQLALAVVAAKGAPVCLVILGVADPHLPSKYHRARWMDPRAAAFLGMDPWEGDVLDPPSLHRYLYARLNPQGNTDPTGRESAAEFSIGAAMQSALQAMAISAPLRALHAASELRAGADLGSVASEFLVGLATDAAVSVVLFGAFQYAPRLFKIAQAGRAARGSSSVWNLAARQRGLAIERLILGGPGRGVRVGEAVIDDFANGVATSIKSVDLSLKSYQSMSAIQRVLSGYARDMATYTFNLAQFPAGAVSERVLVIAIEEGAATAAQAEVLAAFVRNARYTWPNLKIAIAAIP